MSGPSNTLLIEGSFEELADEFAHYLDEVQKKQTPDNANVQSEITPLLEKGQKDEVLKKLVTASDVLNTAPEKGTPSSSLLNRKDYMLTIKKSQNSEQPTTSSSI